MIGAIAGDIIGSIYEHNRIKTVEFPLFGFGNRFTDDTVLTVAVADSILHGKNYAERFETYYYRFPNSGYGGNFEAWARSHDHKPYNSWGNGSAMRVGPVGLSAATLDAALDEARRSAEATHNHPEGIKGAQAVASAIFLIRSGKRKSDVAQFIAEKFGYNLAEPIDSIRRWYQFDVSCQGTVPPAIRAFLEADSFEDAIRLAISLGGDSDTLACIAGSLAEAYFGVPAEIAERTRQYLPDGLSKVVDAFNAKFWPAPRAEYLQTRFKVSDAPAPLPDEFAIVTACNPDGRADFETANAKRTRSLKSSLEMQKLRCWEITGCSPDLQHQEPGFGIATSLELALGLGRSFQQEAIYFVENGKLFLVNCGNGSRFILGKFWDRTAAVSDLGGQGFKE